MTEKEIRIKCLELALGTADPEKSIRVDEMLQKAETLFRYVTEGPASNNVLKVGGLTP